MKRWHWIAIALLPLMVAAILVASPRLGGGTEQVEAQAGMYLALDLDTGGGPCADIDDDVTHNVGETYNVGVCVGGMETALGAIQFSVFYDDTLNSSPNTACATGDCLDTNPDANAGSTTWGTSLGSGWDCNIMDLSPPKGDKDGVAANGTGEAFLGCWSLVGPWTLGDNEATGVLAQVSFTAIAGGNDSLTIGSVIIGNAGGAEIGSCNPTSEVEMTCSGGYDDKIGPTPLPPTATITPTSAATRCPNGLCPTSTPTVRAWTKTPTPVPTGTPAPPTEQPTSPPPPPPPPPPSGGTGPKVVPPATGDGSSATPWTGTAVWVLVAAGALSLSLGGLCLRRARNR
jgi:hypothetical protein